MATDMVSTDPSVDDQFNEGFLHRDKLRPFRDPCPVVDINSSRDWLLLWWGIKADVESSDESINRDLERLWSTMLATDMTLGAVDIESKWDENEPFIDVLYMDFRLLSNLLLVAASKAL